MSKPEQYRVLIVDDAPEIVSMLSDALSLEGLTVISAHGGRQAISMINSERPDIVLMDAQMPGIDGFHACEIIKASPGHEDLPVIFMTGFNESEHVTRGFASGGVDFVAKPIILDQLLARIKVHLAAARRTRSAHLALDVTGRPVLACDQLGKLQWATSQATGILQSFGIRHDRGAYLPGEIIDWLGDNLTGEEASTALERSGQVVEFRLIGCADAEYLMRLVDRRKGGSEQMLASTYGLTLREAEVLLWVAHGKANKEIAEILNMAPRTVNKHLEQIFIKLAVEKRTAAATKAVRVLWRDS